MCSRWRFLLFLAPFVLAAPQPARAYSVLAHEASIDTLWDASIRPLLLRRFPRTSPDALNEARSYAYGGSLIQDLGYYPFGNHFFSNLLHYVRSGDFVERLIANARDVDEYAFALGALAHYSDDNAGHPGAVNPSVPVTFPKLRKKFGDRVTYAEAPSQHVIVEFSFDIVQVAGGAYLPDAYRSFIGFHVAKPLLELTFQEIYGLQMKDIFPDEDRALGTYRYAVSQLIPELTRAAWRDKEKEIEKLTPRVSQSGFVFAYSRRDYEKSFGVNYQRPGLFARFLAFLYRLLPKVGPLRPLAFKAPTADTERLFAQSFRVARERFREALNDVSDGHLNLRNTNFDTGELTRHGAYSLADDTYAELVDHLSKQHFLTADDALRRNIQTFYGSRPERSALSKAERKHWKTIEKQLAELAH